MQLANVEGGASEFECQLAAAWPPRKWRSHAMVVAVSGGPDSVALVRGLAALASQSSVPARLEVAHFNHQWRDESSDGDEAFVRQLAADLGLRIHTGRGTRPTTGHGEGWEAAARRARYAFLVRTAQSCHARYVAVAHTRDDQCETVLARILRGTGLHGLAGIPRVRRLTDEIALVRPLLDIPRSTIIEYLASLNQPYREDPTNVDPRFLRARIRTRLWPLLRQEFNPRIADALRNLADSARENHELVRDVVERRLAECLISQSVDRCDLRRLPVIGLSPPIGRALLRHVWRLNEWPERNMNRQQWRDLWDAVADPGSTRRVFPGGITIATRGDVIRIERPDDDRE